MHLADKHEAEDAHKVPFGHGEVVQTTGVLTLQTNIRATTSARPSIGCSNVAECIQDAENVILPLLFPLCDLVFAHDILRLFSNGRGGRKRMPNEDVERKGDYTDISDMRLALRTAPAQAIHAPTYNIHITTSRQRTQYMEVGPHNVQGVT